MIPVCTKIEDDSMEGIRPVIPIRNRSLVEDLVYRESPGSCSDCKNIVVVMDALKEFSIEPLMWALEHVIKAGYMVTLLGVMPWLNLPLSCKTRSNVWTLDLNDLCALKERKEWKSDIKYQKIRTIVELCENYGVVPHMKVAMGYPVKLLILEKTTGLHATWVVLDRHLKKNMVFYRERIPCNVVMMNNDGEADMLKVRPMLDKGEQFTPEASPAATVPLVPKIIIPQTWMDILTSKDQTKLDDK